VSESSGGSIRSPAAAFVVEEALGFVLSRAIYVAAKLGIADLLVDGPLTSDELAARSGAHGPSLGRFLRTLASAGIFSRTDTGGRFELNQAAGLLRSDVEGSLRELAVYYGELAYRGWEEALHSVRTGEPGFPRVFGTGFWDYLEQNPEAATTFNGAMRGGAKTRALALRAHAWEGTETVVDLGGGDGTLLVDLLSHHAGLRGIVVDRPHAVATARARILEAGLEARCEARAGDLFSEIPSESDVYTLAIVLHDWDDEHAGAILRTCRQAMRDDSRLLIVELVMSESGSPSLGQLLDLHMLVELGGRERTELEWRALLEESGFRLTGVRPAPPWSVLEAVPT
jgi:O-methyltransferase/methyltransferase family protein